MTRFRESLAKTLLVAFSVSSATLYMAGYASAQNGMYMSRAQCGRLTSSNYQSCCLALNRSSIMTPGQVEQCPPWTTEAINQSYLDEGWGETGNVTNAHHSHHHHGDPGGGHHGGGHHGGGGGNSHGGHGHH
ncbi:hypothetical protein [Mesorhizobium sp. ANAO-SY3R2]|uniref:hypothetical protein n=1 Tax=Mesorhizobium sp. ANAO-SY3R2 TaxID=3166644 RepID=UPI00366B18D2